MATAITMGNALVASADPAFRARAVSALRRLGVRCVSETESGLPLAATMSGFAPPDVLLFDGAGAELCEACGLLGERRSGASTLVLLALDQLCERCVESALRLGVRGFVSREADSDELERALVAMYRGDIWLSRRTLSTILLNSLLTTGREAIKPPPGEPARLSPREQEIVEMIAHGRTNKEIARDLGASPRTIQAHLSHIFAKLGVSHRRQLIPSQAYTDTSPMY